MNNFLNQLPRAQDRPYRRHHASLKRLLAILLSTSLLAYAKGNTFDKVRYNGGTVPTKVGPKEWNNKLTITPDLILLMLKDGQKAEIHPKFVTSLSYGQEAHRRVGTMIALAVLVTPVALFGLFAKTRLHFIGVQYKTADGKNGGWLLQGDKNNYRAILVALQGVTGVPVSVGEKDREFIPVEVTTRVAKEPAETQTWEEKPPASRTQEAATVNVTLLGVVGYATDEGLKITSVEAGSPGERLFLKPGDVISKIDGNEVKNGRDIESAVAASTSGTIKVVGLSQTGIGMIQFEREIKVR